MIDSKVDIKKCTGCGACKDKCPKAAISLEGLYPHPIVNNDLCNSCGSCLSTCPVLVDYPILSKSYGFFAARSNHPDTNNESSGGIFGSIVRQLIQDNWYFAGAIFSDTFEVKHVVSNDPEIIKKMYGSKYVQSDCTDIYKNVKKLLLQEKKVVFSGVPCQVYALKCYLSKEYKNLITIDLLCTGVAAPSMFQSRLKEIAGDREITSIKCRDQIIAGWCGPVWSIKFKDGSTYIKKPLEGDPYLDGLIKDYLERDSCYDCKFAPVPRCSDITLGDFWGLNNVLPELPKNAISYVLLNTPKGRDLFDKCDIDYKYELPFELAYSNRVNPKKPIPTERKKAIQYFTANNSLKSSSVKNDNQKRYDISLLTTWFAENYGAIYTSYSLYSFLDKLGYSVQMLQKPSFWWPNLISLKKNPKAIDFANRHQYHYSSEITPKSIDSIKNQSTTFIVGSDQLWNPKLYKFFCNLGHYTFLDFLDEKSKKISYSTSFAFPFFHDADAREHNEVKKLLNKFDSISVREDSGVTICNNIFDVDATCTIDPVFLTTVDEYNQLINDASINVEVPYFLAYLLDPSDETRLFVQKISEIHKIKCIYVRDAACDVEYRQEKPFMNTSLSRAEDWLWLIKNANFIITDSFHGSCFSIIFKKHFISIKNEHRGTSRFESLFNKLGLMDRIFDDSDLSIEEFEKTIRNIDYDAVSIKLNAFLSDSKKWLLSAINSPKAAKHIFPNGHSLQLDHVEYGLFFADVSQLNLKKIPTVVEDVVKALPNGSCLQQVVGKIGEPIINVPAPFGILIINKTSNYFTLIRYYRNTIRKGQVEEYIGQWIDSKVEWFKLNI